MQTESSLARLIKRRSQQLGLDAQALGLRLGYQNPAKAAGRVHALCDGHIFNRKSRAALSRLANALEVSENVMQDALVATEALMAELTRRAQTEKRQAADADAARWRANFRPHAVIETARRCPSQIVICGLTGGIGRWLIVPVDPSSAPITFVRQVLDALPDKLRAGPDGQKGVPFFGKATGFTLNYSPDRAVRFTLNGEALETLPKAYRPGEVEISIGGGRRSPLTIARMLDLA
jgi:hypothetical protein